MSNIRIAFALALAAVAGALTVGGAAAQSAGNEPAGQPLALLAGLRPPHATHELPAHRIKTVAHARTTNGASRKAAVRTHTRLARLAGKTERTVAAAPAAVAPAQTASDAPPENAGQTLQTTPSLTALPSLAAAADNTVATVADAVPVERQAVSGSVVIDGQTVEVAPSDQVNAIDLAADDHHDAATAMVADHNGATPAVRTVFAAPAHQDSSSVGSASWIAQILAALGGAVAAGAVAWFLIGSGPQRMYG